MFMVICNKCVNFIIHLNPHEPCLFLHSPCQSLKLNEWRSCCHQKLRCWIAAHSLQHLRAPLATFHMCQSCGTPRNHILHGHHVEPVQNIHVNKAISHIHNCFGWSFHHHACSLLVHLHWQMHSEHTQK